MAGNSQARQGGRYAARRGAARSTTRPSALTRARVRVHTLGAPPAVLVASWDVSSATTTHYMFWNAALFNGSLADWDTARVASMHGM